MSQHFSIWKILIFFKKLKIDSSPMQYILATVSPPPLLSSFPYPIFTSHPLPLYSLQKREDHQDTTAEKNKIRFNNPCHKKIYLEFQLKFCGKCTKSINHWPAAEHCPYFPFEEQLSSGSLLSSTHFPGVSFLCSPSHFWHLFKQPKLLSYH